MIYLDFLLHIFKRVNLYTIYQYFEMDMWTRTYTGITGKGYLLALLYRLAALYKDLAQVSVSCLFAVRMVYHDNISVSGTPACS